MIAGFVATIILSVMMIANTLIGLMPELNVIVMLSDMMNKSLAFGWMGAIYSLPVMPLRRATALRS